MPGLCLALIGARFLAQEPISDSPPSRRDRQRIDRGPACRAPSADPSPDACSAGAPTAHVSTVNSSPVAATKRVRANGSLDHGAVSRQSCRGRRGRARAPLAFNIPGAREDEQDIRHLSGLSGTRERDIRRGEPPLASKNRPRRRTCVGSRGAPRAPNHPPPPRPPWKHFHSERARSMAAGSRVSVALVGTDGREQGVELDLGEDEIRVLKEDQVGCPAPRPRLFYCSRCRSGDVLKGGMSL